MVFRKEPKTLSKRRTQKKPVFGFYLLYLKTLMQRIDFASKEKQYRLHLFIRLGHDKLYSKNKGYKKWSDKPYSEVVHRATLVGFVTSFLFFGFLQYAVPSIFDLLSPQKILAGNNNKVWTSTAEYSSPVTTDGNLNVGSHAGDDGDGSIELASTSLYYGNGEDGPLTISGAYNLMTQNVSGASNTAVAKFNSTQTGRTGVDSFTTTLTQPIAVSGSSTLVVNDVSGFSTNNAGAGEEVFIGRFWQSGDGTCGAGCDFSRTDIAKVSSINIATKTITLTSPIYGRDVNNVAQGYPLGAVVQRIPHYSNVTINSGGSLTSSQWNGSSGGAVVFKANGSVTINSGGSINANGLGYAGGGPGIGQAGQQVIIAGSPPHYWDGGRGGAGYGGVGGAGGSAGSAAGGAGGQTYSSAINFGSGTKGGGSINIFATSVLNYAGATITSNAIFASPEGSSGGSVNVKTNDYSGGGGVQANGSGGMGGGFDGDEFGNYDWASTGGGGGGRISVNSLGVKPAITPTANGGPSATPYPGAPGAATNIVTPDWYTQRIPYVTEGNLGLNGVGLRADISPSRTKWGNLSFRGNVSVGTTIKFQVRASDTLGSGTFVNPDDGSTNTWSTSVPVGDYTSSPYSLVLSSTILMTKTFEVIVQFGGGTATPRIDSLTLTYDSLEAPTNANLVIQKTDSSVIYSASGNTLTSGTSGGLGYTNETSLKVIANNLTCVACGTSTNIRPEVEAKPVGTNFDGLGTVTAGSGANFGVVTGLSSITGYHLRVRSIDDQGRVSSWTSYGNNAESEADLTVDQIAPAGTVVINSNAQHASSASITLTSTASDSGGSNLSQMQFSNDGTTWSGWEMYNVTKAWTLSIGDGVKTVYAQYRDNARNVSGKVFTSKTDWDSATLTDTDTISISGSAKIASSGGDVPDYGTGNQGDIVISAGTTRNISEYVTGYNGTTVVPNFNNLTVDGTLTSDVQVPLLFRVKGVLTINSTGKIDVSGKGLTTGSFGGGGYGGAGGSAYDGYDGICTGYNQAARDAFPAAITYGSGKAGGGGLIKIHSNSVLILGSGSILANGNNSSDASTGAGSGGGIHIITNNSLNAGSIKSIGGGGFLDTAAFDQTSGSGGGGRIYLQSSTITGINTANVAGGPNAFPAGVAYGTVCTAGGQGVITQISSPLKSVAKIGGTTTGLRFGNVASPDKYKFTSLKWSGTGFSTVYKMKVQVRAADTWGVGDAGYVNPVVGDSSWYEISTSSGTIPILSTLANFKTLEVRAELVGDGNNTPILDDISIESAAFDTINLDTVPSPNVAGLAAYTDSGKATPILETEWNGVAAPYFEWTPNVSDTVGYKYCFGTASCTPNIDNFAATTKTLDLSGQGTYPDNTYYMRVVAYDTAGNVSTVPAQYAYKLDRTVPGAVTGFSASQNQEDRIGLNWSAIYDPNGSPISYIIERIRYSKYLEGFTVNDITPGKIWSEQGAYGYASYAGLAGSSYTDMLPVGDQGIKFVYRIKAVDESGKVGPHQAAPVYGLTRDGINPTTPYSVTAVVCSFQSPSNCSDAQNDALKGHEVTLSWQRGNDDGTGIQRYLVYRANAYSLLEADYAQLASISVPSPLPAGTNLTYTDNVSIADYTQYYYRIVAEDGSTPANKSSFIPTNDENYVSIRTPDVTAPTAPVVTASAAGLDASNSRQKTVITWTASTDAGAGIKTYRIYRVMRTDITDLSGSLIDIDFAEITGNSNVQCDLAARTCYEQDLEDTSFYYYRVKAVDNNPYNNISGYSAISTVKTLSSAVPTPPRGRIDAETRSVEPYPYVATTKGSTLVDEVGHQAVIYFSGSYEKDCFGGATSPCLVRYDIYRSADAQNWSKVGEQVPNIIGNDRDSEYTFVNNNLTDATKYYYQVRAVGNNPSLSDGGITSSGIGGAKTQGWDITPDTTAPMLPQELKVKDIHDDGISFKRNIVTWARISDPLRNGANDFKEYKVYRSIDGVLWTQLLDDFGNNPLYSYDPDKTAAENQQINLATNYYMDLIPNAVANRYYYYYVTASDDAGIYTYPNTQIIINEFANESNPPRDSENKIIAVSLNPAIAKPTIATSGGFAPKLTNLGVSSATIEWYADQDTDSVVEFKAVNDNRWITIGDRAVRRYNEAHSVNLFGLLPKTEYQFKLISRNYLGNEDVLGDTEGERNILPRLITDEFNVTPGKVTTTTTGAEINWVTNLEASSAFVEYELVRQGSDEPQGKTVGVNPDALSGNPKNHRVVIQGLKSNRTYKYKIKSISKDGFVAEYPTIKNENRINETFATRSFDTGQFTLAPSSSNVAERQITSTTAQIVWQTGMESTSWVDYSTKSGVYDVSSGNDNLTTQHVVVIEGLVPGTTYYYRVRAKDSNDIEYTSQEYSFTAVLKPKISNMRVKDVTPYSVTISWDTNVDTETIVNWGQTAAYGEKKGISGVSKAHELKIDNLIDNQEYHYQILAKDETGNEVADDDKVIRTPLDTEGPKIENVKLDVLPMGESDNTAQVIISWTTNKPATRLIEYDEGVIGGKYSQQSIEDLSLNTSHTVIVKELKAATSYHYRIVSKDKRNNASVSQDYTFVTPTKEKSILQLIIKSLEETFSWTRNLNLFFSGIGKRFGGK